mmetsp:Transcript_23290/g.58923  ORF Transcript_23290/g.58923 Transcript_23290/m.58923 type:complete len:216 (-) Transcript_23290:1264-1911(-)
MPSMKMGRKILVLMLSTGIRHSRVIFAPCLIAIGKSPRSNIFRNLEPGSCRESKVRFGMSSRLSMTGSSALAVFGPGPHCEARRGRWAERHLRKKFCLSIVAGWTGRSPAHNHVLVTFSGSSCSALLPSGPAVLGLFGFFSLAYFFAAPRTFFVFSQNKEVMSSSSITSFSSDLIRLADADWGRFLFPFLPSIFLFTYACIAFFWSSFLYCSLSS